MGYSKLTVFSLDLRRKRMQFAVSGIGRGQRWRFALLFDTCAKARNLGSMADLSYTASYDLILLGGGHSHVAVLADWIRHGLPAERIALITPSSHLTCRTSVHIVRRSSVYASGSPATRVLQHHHGDATRRSTALLMCRPRCFRTHRARTCNVSKVAAA